MPFHTRYAKQEEYGQVWDNLFQLVNKFLIEFSKCIADIFGLYLECIKKKLHSNKKSGTHQVT